MGHYPTGDCDGGNDCACPPKPKTDYARYLEAVGATDLVKMLEPDAPTGSPTQDILHVIALTLGWRTDWSTGSPITLQAVLDEITRLKEWAATASALGIAHEVSMTEVERRYARWILERSGGNKTHAARKLGIDRRSLYRRLEPDSGGK